MTVGERASGSTRADGAANATRVGVVGLGPVGRAVAEGVSKTLPTYEVTAVSARRPQPAREFAAGLPGEVAVVPASEVAGLVDVVIECAPAAVFREIAEPVTEQGKTLVVLSAGALLDAWDVVERAQVAGARILVPTGALLGLDAVQAAAEGHVESVRMTTRKPVAGLDGAPYLQGRGLDLSAIREPTRVFEGSAREAAAGFPANLNVAVALSLAGVGPDRTRLEIWADPAARRNMHTIEVTADSATFSMTIENIPSDNPRTGRITALSVLALLRKRAASLQVGT